MHVCVHMHTQDSERVCVCFMNTCRVPKHFTVAATWCYYLLPSRLGALKLYVNVTVTFHSVFQFVYPLM